MSILTLVGFISSCFHTVQVCCLTMCRYFCLQENEVQYSLYLECLYYNSIYSVCISSSKTHQIQHIVSFYPFLLDIVIRYYYLQSSVGGPGPPPHLTTLPRGPFEDPRSPLNIELSMYTNVSILMLFLSNCIPSGSLPPFSFSSSFL